MEESDFETTLLVVKECFVYKIHPRAKATGYRYPLYYLSFSARDYSVTCPKLHNRIDSFGLLLLLFMILIVIVIGVIRMESCYLISLCGSKWTSWPCYTQTALCLCSFIDADRIYFYTWRVNAYLNWEWITMMKVCSYESIYLISRQCIDPSLSCFSNSSPSFWKRSM